MAVRKIDLMHRHFGKCHGRKCKDCQNLVKLEYHCKPYIKCRVYGITQSEASDWVQKYEACGMFNKEWTGGDIIRLVKPERAAAQQDNDPIEGQVSIFETSK